VPQTLPYNPVIARYEFSAMELSECQVRCIAHPNRSVSALDIPGFHDLVAGAEFRVLGAKTKAWRLESQEAKTGTGISCPSFLSCLTKTFFRQDLQDLPDLFSVSGFRPRGASGPEGRN
jgi:hypothetical protein